MSRIARLFLVTFVGFCIFFPLMMRGHGRVAGIFFLAWMVVEFVIFLRMKPGPADFAPLRKAGQVKSSRRLRMAGYVLIAAAIYGLLRTYKVSPWWPVLVGLAVNGSFQWLFFSAAKRIEEMSPDEWERRFGK